jgi:hemolysin III
MTIKMREPVSGLTHLIGAILSVIGLVLMIYYAVIVGTVWHIVSFSIFGGSLILLYTASSLYHLLCISDKGVRVLRKIDHMMIYILIAGTYTPICLIPLRGGWGYSMLAIIWGIALVGIIMKLLWFDAPRWLYTLFYLIMGWLVIIAFWPMARTIPAAGIAWMVAGGVLYSIGAAIYGTKWPKLNFKLFGFHEIFHVFVLLGSFSHFWFIFRYILYLR